MASATQPLYLTPPLADDPTGPTLESPDPADLIVDVDINFAQIVLASHRP